MCWRCDELRMRYAARQPDDADRKQKLAGRLLLADTLSGVVIPTSQQWYGINKLYRDEEWRDINK